MSTSDSFTDGSYWQGCLVRDGWMSHGGLRILTGERPMTDRETYIERQKASGIEVGDTVRVVRQAPGKSKGWALGWNCNMKELVGRDEVVLGMSSFDNGGFRLSNTACYPYFVLEIVKKANGSVPGKTEPIITGESTMKNSRFDIEIVKEKTDDKGKATNGIVVKRYTKWHVDAVDATAYATKKHGLAILEQEEAGFEVAILVHNFCG